jgi:hypothetical protein
MKRIYLMSISIIMLMTACQKEVSQATKQAANATNGVVTTSTIKGVSLIKDGFPYPNIQSSSSLVDDEIGWFIDFNALAQSNLNAPTKGPVVSSLGDPSLYCGEIKTVNLYAGQNILMGTLTYANDATNFYVTYTTDPDWYMTQTHLYIGALETSPLSGGGTPSPGKFPIKSTFTASTLAQTATYTIPLTSFNLSGFIIAAHASVIRVDIDGDIIAKETAWAAGTRFQSNKNWATYVTGAVSTCGGGGGGEGDFTKSGNQN